METSKTWEDFCKLSHFYKTVGLRLDISSMELNQEDFQALAPLAQKALSEMAELEKGGIANSDEKRMVGHYWLRNWDLAPNEQIKNDIQSALLSVKAFIGDIVGGKLLGHTGKRFTNILLVGIGGSALGPQLLADALADQYAPVTFSCIDNTDPDGFYRIKHLLSNKLEQTLVVVTSKSGGTIETRNGMLEIQSLFTEQHYDYTKHFVAITCAGSKLDVLAIEENWLARFPMWDFVGGRFSVCSVVGLLPAGLLGINIDEFLSGARRMDDITRAELGLANPALTMALVWYLVGKGKGMKDLVVLPYKDRLVLFSKYLQQMIMESLGKKFDRNGSLATQGLSVYGNKGSTDQHAYIQQLRDGLDNFFVTFIEVLKDFSSCSEKDKLLFVEPGITSGDYLNGFYQGTRRALEEGGRRSITISLDNLSPFSLGALIALFERAVGFYASLVNINAYHQPGVEAGKIAANNVIAIERAILAELKGNSQDFKTAQEMATAIGKPRDTLSVFKILDRLSLNEYSKIINNGERDPRVAAFKLNISES